jgi:hypothetical protein
MRKHLNIILFTLLNACMLYSQNGISISLTEAKLNEVIDLAKTANFISYSYSNGLNISEMIYICDEDCWDIDQILAIATLDPNVSVDIKENNRFSFISTFHDEEDGSYNLFSGKGRLDKETLSNKHPLYPNVYKTPMSEIIGFGHINGSILFKDNKIILNPDDVDVTISILADGLLNCVFSLTAPIVHITSLPQYEINVGTAILPDALKGYFLEESANIKTTEDKITFGFECVPFNLTELDENYNGTAAFSVELKNLIVPSTANSVIKAGSKIVLKPGFTVEKGASFIAEIKAYEFGDDRTNW